MGTRYFLLLAFAAACSQSHASTMQVSSDPTSGAMTQTGSRLKMIMAKGDDGSSRAVGWWDSQFKWECIEGQTTDGKDRCVPAKAALYGATYFSDDKCTAPIIASTGCSDLVAAQLHGGCRPQMQFFKLETPYTGTVYFSSAAGCTTMSAAGRTFWQVGQEIAPTEFVEITRVME